MYKALPEGGYSARPAESPVVVQRLVRQGWSETKPVEARPAAGDPPAPESVEAVAAETAPKRRGRRARVN